MDKVARLSDQDRRDLFMETASAKGIHPAIIEKDFWVCWVLKKLFASEQLQGQLVFKGGTSLSKVHRLIERFSEDIDLVLNWELLGYQTDKQDPWQTHSSHTQQDKFNKAFNKRADDYIRTTLHPLLTDLFSDVDGIHPVVSTREQQVINIGYPAAFGLEALRPEVKLEIGPLASWMPSNRYTIRPYVADVFGDVFEDANCPVVAITAERTFWEKATILHQLAHRGDKVMPANYSRHYYDLYQLAASPVKDNALGDLQLLKDVVKYKMQFYHCPWAKYEDAKPGTFLLMPTDKGGQELARDYQKMREMIFVTPPAWVDVLAALSDLQQQINRLPGDTKSE